MNLIKNIVLFLVLFIYPVICFSQTDIQIDSSKENFDRAIQFYMINQVIAAYKYHYSENSAVRFTINASGLFNDEDSDEIEYRDRTTDTIVYYFNRQYTNSNQFFEIKSQYLYNIKTQNIIQLYFGGGPFVSYRFIQYEDGFKYYYSNSEENSSGSSKRNENIWNIGLSAVIGLECIVYKNINLFAEYETIISRGWRNVDYYSNSQTYARNNEYDSWNYELKGIRIGLGIYF